MPDGLDIKELDQAARAELNALSRPVAESVTKHLIMTGRLLEEDPDLAYAHAQAARRLASRIAVVREATGLAAYRAGEWQTAISELRTFHRLTGTQIHVAILADCERALGRPEKAIDLYRAADRTKLDPATAVELLIVAAGARGDMGQRPAAVAMLQVPELTATSEEPWVARLRYAYADALLAIGRRAEAREWFARAAVADPDVTTDAAERLLDLDGVLLEEHDDEDEFESDGQFDGEGRDGMSRRDGDPDGREDNGADDDLDDDGESEDDDQDLEDDEDLDDEDDDLEYDDEDDDFEDDDFEDDEEDDDEDEDDDFEDDDFDEDDEDDLEDEDDDDLDDDESEDDDLDDEDDEDDVDEDGSEDDFDDEDEDTDAAAADTAEDDDDGPRGDNDNPEVATPATDDQKPQP